MKLNVKAFSITVSLVMGIGIFLITWWIMLFSGASGEETVVAVVYRGYHISPVGSLIGLVWGLADGLIGGMVFAWLYNLLVDKFSK